MVGIGTVVVVDGVVVAVVVGVDAVVVVGVSFFVLTVSCFSNVSD